MRWWIANQLRRVRRIVVVMEKQWVFLPHFRCLPSRVFPETFSHFWIVLSVNCLSDRDSRRITPPECRKPPWPATKTSAWRSIWLDELLLVSRKICQSTVMIGLLPQHHNHRTRVQSPVIIRFTNMSSSFARSNGSWRTVNMTDFPILRHQPRHEFCCIASFSISISHDMNQPKFQSPAILKTVKR